MLNKRSVLLDKKDQLKLIRNRLNYWYNLFSGNYEDLINLITNWNPDVQDNWNNLGRYWFNYLSSENAFRSKVMH